VSCDECPACLVATNDPDRQVGGAAAAAWGGGGLVVGQRLPVGGPLSLLGVVGGFAVVAPLEGMRSRIAAGLDRRVSTIEVPLV
jgi:hypothetical protein